MSRPDPDAGHRNRLARLRRPARIVVAGASSTRPNMGRRLLAAVGRSFTGELLAVHPTATMIDGYRCVSGLPELAGDGPVDVLVVATPAAGVSELVAGSAQLDPAAVVVLSALDPVVLDGAVATAFEQRYDPARHPWVVGPGSNGYLSGAAGLAVTSNPSVVEVPVTDRGVLVVGQSGGLALSALWEPLRRAGVPVGMAVTTGTQPVLPWWTVAAVGARHGRFDAVAVLAESVPDRAALAALGEAAGSAGVPVLALQVGRSRAGGEAAQSHSGALATPGRLFEAACQRYHIRPARSLPELVDLCGHATAGPARRQHPPAAAEPAPAGVAVVSPSGGALSYALDQLADPRLRLAALTAATRTGLAPLLGASVTAGNPLDLGAAAATDPNTLAAAVRLLRADPAVARVVVVLAASAGLAELAAALATAAERKPVDLVCLAAGPDDLGRARARAGADPAVRVWSELTAVRTALAIEVEPTPIQEPDPPPAPATAVATAVARVSSWPAGAHSETESADLLRMLGIARPREATVGPAAGRASLRSLAEQVPMPWVLKGMAPDATHKHAAGLLVTGVRTVEEAQARIAGFAAARPDLAAVLVQEHIRHDGPEYLLAVRHHPVLGPHLLFGIGGTAVEQTGNVEVCLLPAHAGQLATILRRVATRGEVALPDDPARLPQLTATAFRLEELVRGCATAGSALTVELNPVVTDPRDGRLLALDALCVKSPIKDVPS